MRFTLNKKIAFVVAIVLIATFIQMFYTLNYQYNDLMNNKKSQLKELVDNAYSILVYYNELSEKSQLTKKESQEKAKEIIRKMRYGKDGYYWIDNDKYILQVLPPDITKEGMNRENLEDNHGKKMVKELVDGAVKDGETYVTYHFRRLGSEIPYPKLGYTKYFKEWGYVIGTGFYIDDVDEYYSQNRNKLLIFFFALITVVFFIYLWIALGINRIIKSLKTETTEIINAILDGNLTKRGDSNRINFEFKSIIDGINQLSEAFIKPINLTSTYLDKISRGDIPPKITDDYKGDFNEIKNNLNSLIDANKTITEIAQKISEGDFSINIQERSGEDKLLISLRKSIQTIKSVENSINQTISEIQKGNLSFRTDLSIFLGGWKNLLTSLNSLTDTFVKPIKTTSEYINRISKGDIPEPIKEEYKGDFNGIKESI
ncbi:methyl-accepting chemotaxis protein, partial [bacterium]|nr:methyl-accepting chemotaxis protein [bacterium]